MPKKSRFAYKKQDLLRDGLAALVVTALAIPESLAFAAIVGLPPVTGLYTALLAPIVFALFSSTRRLVVGADSATAALIAAGAVAVAQVGTAAYGDAVALIGIITAVILLLMGLLRLGFLANLISRPVLVGFLAGVGLQLIITKLPAMLGIATSGSVWQHITMLVDHIPDVNGMALTIAVLVVGVILILRHTKLPGELVGLVAATAFAFAFNVNQYGVQLIGALPAGLPSLTFPPVTIDMIVTLLPVSLSLAIVILAQSSAVIRSLAGEHDEPVRINQDLRALGFANAVSALTRGFVVNGSPPRSVAADIAGGRSQMVNVFMSLMIGALLLFGASLFTHVPEAALAAIIFVIGLKLVRVGELRYIMSRHRLEFIVAMIALTGTLFFGVSQGVIIAVVISLMERLSRQYQPKDEILLRDGKLSEWAKDRLGEAPKHGYPEGILVYSFDGSLFFENAHYFAMRVRKAINGSRASVRYLVIDVGAVETIDYTAVEILKQLYHQIGIDGVRLSLAHVSPSLKAQFKKYGLVDLVGEENIYSTLTAAIHANLEPKQNVDERVRALGIEHTSMVVVGGAVLDLLNLRSSHEIDLVVSSNVYTHFRDEQLWQEFTQVNGKKMLSRGGIKIMTIWGGQSLNGSAARPNGSKRLAVCQYCPDYHCQAALSP